MKKLFVILLGTVLLLPIYSQEEEPLELTEVILIEDHEDRADPGDPEEEQEFLDDAAAPMELAEEEPQADESEPDPHPWYFQPQPLDMARQRFEFGSKTGVGLDNDFIGTGDFFTKNIVIDLNEIGNRIGVNGVNFNVDVFHDMFLNFRLSQDWGLGFFIGVDSHIYGNLPQSLFQLLAEGNIDLPDRTSSGMVSASGAAFFNVGANGFMQFGKLRISPQLTFFSPLIYIPGESGITYSVGGEYELSMSASGEISMYSPFFEDGRVHVGTDISVDGEYALFSFLDVGASLSSIPLVPVKLQNRMRVTMDDFSYTLENPLSGNNQDLSLPELQTTQVYDSADYWVFRPLQFDVFARYKPLNSEMLIIRPNIGFTAAISEKTGYFNAGLEAMFNYANLIKVHLGTGIEQAIWKHRIGFALNLRAAELNAEVQFRSQSFTGTFRGQGMGIAIGTTFGW